MHMYLFSEIYEISVSKNLQMCPFFDHLHLEISVLSRDKGDIAIRVRIAPEV